MKKIYFNERFIVATNLSDCSFDDSVEQVVVTDHKDIPNLLKYFYDSDNIHGLVLKSDDEETLFSMLISQFKSIIAAGGVVFDVNGFVLIIKRFGIWDLPKGKVERGEDVDEAAIREVEEECGISGVTLGEFITPTYHVYTMKGITILKTTYWYAMNYTGDEQLVPQVAEDITDARWVPLNDLDEYMSNTYQTIRDVFIAAKIVEM